jgi:hypothetical protein
MDKYLLISAISIPVRCSIFLLLKSRTSRLTAKVTREVVREFLCLEYDKIVAVHKRSTRRPDTS